MTALPMRNSESADPQSRLLALPDELLHLTFSSLPPAAATAAGATCRKLNKIASEPLLWRLYCTTTWNYWQDSRLLKAQVKAPIGNTEWREKFLGRVRRDAENGRVFETLLQSQQRRIAYIEDVAASGYDAKELLLDYCNTPDHVDDVLARRYWAEATLGLVHRTRALNTWQDLANSDIAPLEPNLAAFDLFVVGSRRGDVQDIESELDIIAEDLLSEHAHFHTLDVRQKAETIAAFLRARHLVGNDAESEYHAMHNNFISFALLEEPHTSLPLQSTAIYCSVAKRLGVAACPCNYPIHIYAMIPLKQHSNGEAASSDTQSSDDFIYMDPWRQETPVGMDVLESQLHQLGIPEFEHSQYLTLAFTRDLVLRTGRNIMKSWEEHRRGQIELRPGAPYVDQDAAFYSFLWSILIIGVEHREVSSHRRRSYLPYLLELFQQTFPEDISIIEQNIAHMFRGHPQRDEFNLLIQSLRAADENAQPVSRRTADTDNVKYKIGQVFQHKRYNYIGVVIGWDTRCQAPEQWINQMNVDDLPAGRRQSFYHILGEDKSKRYVAEENIEPIFRQPAESLMRMAGRYFKRWDTETGMFTSNIRDEYPDD